VVYVPWIDYGQRLKSRFWGGGTKKCKKGIPDFPLLKVRVRRRQSNGVVYGESGWTWCFWTFLKTYQWIGKSTKRARVMALLHIEVVTSTPIRPLFRRGGGHFWWFFDQKVIDIDLKRLFWGSNRSIMDRNRSRIDRNRSKSTSKSLFGGRNGQFWCLFHQNWSI